MTHRLYQTLQRTISMLNENNFSLLNLDLNFFSDEPFDFCFLHTRGMLIQKSTNVYTKYSEKQTMDKTLTWL